MTEINDISIISKEVLTVLSCCKENIIKKIPNKVLKKLAYYAADTKKEVNIDLSKELTQQDILDESKNLIALIFYNYIANDIDKQRIEKIWDINEKKYKEKLNKKYNVEELFEKRNEKNSANVCLTEYKKENIFMKIIKKIFKKWR